MKIFLNKNYLTKYVDKEKNLGFIPTMGALHAGHISLIKKSISQCKKTVVTIFVNKPQFNRRNDFLNYPKTHERDIKILKKLKVDFLYMPTHKEIYPNGVDKKIIISKFGKKLCGKYRVRHFESIADVVNRFIKIIQPSKIFFGEKDMQQLKILEDYIKKNFINIKVIGCKTIREKNGIACSSRNFHLTSSEKNIASKIYKLLLNKKNKIIKKKSTLIDVKKKILSFGVKKIDYIELIDINKIIKPYKKNNKYKIFIAYYLRSTRLIDNI